MPRLAANLSMLYPEHAFLDRFAACAKDGFEAVEFLFPYDHPAATLRRRLDDHGLKQVLFNTVPGDFGAGDRGLACLPERKAEFLAGVDRAIEYAGVLECPRLHAMAGLVPAGPAGGTGAACGGGSQRARLRETYVANLSEAARRCRAAGLDLLIEPINPRDIPGYFLNTQAEAHQVVREVGAPNLKVQMDLYHCQIVEGDLAMRIRQWLSGVGHIQIAGVPQRHEPDVGEVDYPYLFDLLDELGYDGWIGCEYRPAGGSAAGATTAGLGWAKKWLAPRGASAAAAG
jgi:hydroxypyruvate isomerase